MTDLAERMKKHTAGQVTWPEPELGKNCVTCKHYAPIEGHNPTNKGSCRKVTEHQNVQGKNFAGADAIACPLYTAI